MQELQRAVTPPDRNSKTQFQDTKPTHKKCKGNVTMRITRRHVLAAMTASTVIAFSGMADAADTVRIGLPTKTYWPTTIAETAVRQKLFEKEGIAAELTIYRGGAETFEAMAAGAADVILDATSLAAAGRTKGVMSKVVANAAMGYYRLAVDGAREIAARRSRISTARRSRSPRPAPAPTCWRCGPLPTRRSTSRAYRSAAAAWCRTCSQAMSMPPWSIHR